MLQPVGETGVRAAHAGEVLLLTADHQGVRADPLAGGVRVQPGLPQQREEFDTGMILRRPGDGGCDAGGDGEDVGVVERQGREVSQGPPAGVDGVVHGGRSDGLGEGGGVSDGDVPAARVPAGAVKRTDLPQLVGRDGDAGFFLQLAYGGLE